MSLVLFRRMYVRFTTHINVHHFDACESKPYRLYIFSCPTNSLSEVLQRLFPLQKPRCESPSGTSLSFLLPFPMIFFRTSVIPATLSSLLTLKRHFPERSLCTKCVCMRNCIHSEKRVSGRERHVAVMFSVCDMTAWICECGCSENPFLAEYRTLSVGTSSNSLTKNPNDCERQEECSDVPFRSLLHRHL